MTDVLEMDRAVRQQQNDIDALLLEILRGIIVRGHATPEESATLREIASGKFVETADVAQRALAWIETAKRKGGLAQRKSSA